MKTEAEPATKLARIQDLRRALGPHWRRRLRTASIIVRKAALPLSMPDEELRATYEFVAGELRWGADLSTEGRPE